MSGSRLSASLEEQAEALTLYESGSSTQETGDFLGLSRGSIRSIQKVHGIQTRPSGQESPLTKEQEIEMIRLYQSGWTTTQCAQHFGFSSANVCSAVLKRHGLKCRSMADSKHIKAGRGPGGTWEERITPVGLALAKKLYKQGFPVRVIGAIWGLKHEGNLIDLLLKNGVQRRAKLPGWNKGKTGFHPHTEESKKRIAEAMTGRVISEETKIKLSEKGKQRYKDGTLNIVVNKITGAAHHLWKGGKFKAKLQDTIRTTTEYNEWRKAVYKRDSWCCQKCCEKQGKKIIAHHILPLDFLMAKFQLDSLDQAKLCSALWDRSNGITLCRRCHAQIHKTLYSCGV